MSASTQPPSSSLASAPAGLPDDPLHGKRLVLGLSGGVAGYKAAELLRLLTQTGAQVQVVMTEAATRFIAPVTLQALSGQAVYADQWDARPDNNMAHINLTRGAHGIIVAPASADFIAQVAQGRAGDLLSLLCLARPMQACPLWLAPAMNREMWAHPATQRNIEQVRQDGAVLFGPDSGDQACGEVGDGRMLEAADLFLELQAALAPRLLSGRRVLITAGPTFEPIDPVRGLTNRSSGKMGFALARAAREAGAEVTLVAGPVALPTPRGVQRLDVETAQQMADAVMAALTGQDVFIATAAVADWRVAQVAQAKIKKDGSGQSPVLAFEENIDILATVAGRRDAPYCVGFAAESHDLRTHARQKRERKGVPLLVGNLGPATFGRDDNALLLVDAHGVTEMPAGAEQGARADKLSLARALVAEVARRLPSR